MEIVMVIEDSAVALVAVDGVVAVVVVVVVATDYFKIFW